MATELKVGKLYDVEGRWIAITGAGKLFISKGTQSEF